MTHSLGMKEILICALRVWIEKLSHAFFLRCTVPSGSLLFEG
jgi:hypothetical protein